MKPETWQQLESIFFQALELDPAARAAYLDQACHGNAELRAEVDAVLAAHNAATVHEQANLDPENNDDVLPAGTRIGAYQLEERVGRGGMGEVYRAQRADEQYRQEVAIKLVRAGLGGTGMIGRFRMERQILANLQHPNIATLLEGGVTPDGQPYLVMQYVRGVPITEYADQHRLPIAERLKLFRTVCEAVQYAHANLVVHRDLKPSNILVTEEGEGGQVRLLDFGIAKLLESEDADVTIADTAELAFFTPEHAAPEQLQRKPVTTATDVYALGVLLYELLTGVRPFHAPTPMELYRVVCDVEPTRPSGALSPRTVQTRPSVNANTLAGLRALQPAALMRQLRGDLDHIVLKALRKEPERRYASAGQFAEDITRFLKGEPVVARPDAWSYRVSRFVRRNRVAVALASLAGVSLLAGLVGTITQSRRAQAEALQAATERDRAQRVSALLVDMFRISDPDATRGQTVSAREVLARGAARIANDLKDQPEAQADLLSEVGTIYLNLGLFEESASQLERVLQLRKSVYGEQHARVAETLTRLAQVRTNQARQSEALPLAQTASDMLRRQEPTARRDQALGDALLALGDALTGTRAPAKAGEAYAESIQLLEHDSTNDARVARAFFGWAEAAHSEGRFELADSLLQQNIARYARSNGPPNPAVASSLNNLAMLRMFRRKPAEAEPMLREALVMRRRIYGDVHPAVSETLSGLAQALSLLGRFDEAAGTATMAVAVSDSAFGPEHTMSAQVRLALGNILIKMDQGERAVAVLQQAHTILRASRGENAPNVIGAEITMAQAYASMGQFARARDAFTAALKRVERALGPEHAYRAHVLMELARLDFDAGRWADAERQAAEAIALTSKILRPDHRFALWSTWVLARVRVAQGKLVQADSLLRNVLNAQKTSIGNQHPETAVTLVALADVELRRAQTDSALVHARAAVTIFEDHHERGPILHEARSVLGGALAAQGRRAEAEPLLRQSLQELQKQRGTRAWQVSDAQARLRLFLSTGTPVALQLPGSAR